MIDKLDFVSIHIEKCAGESLSLMLRNYFIKFYDINEVFLPSEHNYIHYCSDNDINYINKLKNNIKILLTHISYKSNLSKRLWSSSTISLTCVRNPEKRIISHYYHFDYNKYNKMFNELNECDIIYMLKDYGNIISKRLSGETNNIDDCIKNLQEINYILILEKINDDIPILNNCLNNLYNTNYSINIENENVNKIDYKSYLEIDILVLKNYEIYYNNDMYLYNYICNLSLNERFKNYSFL